MGKGSFRAERGDPRARLRLHVNGVELHATQKRPYLDVTAWRDFPLARVENHANDPDMWTLLYEHMDLDEMTAEAPPPVDQRSHARNKRRLMTMLNVAPGGRRADRFYELVAVAYRYYLEHGMPPAKSIQEDTGAPRRRSIAGSARARRRRFLEPARAQGRAG